MMEGHTRTLGSEEDRETETEREREAAQAGWASKPEGNRGRRRRVGLNGRWYSQ